MDSPGVRRPSADRPEMPASYGIHGAPNGEGLLPWHEVAEKLENAHNYWIATTRPDGRPHAMPVWGVFLDEVFYFSTGPDSRKGRNLAADPHIVVHLESGDEAVILEGVVERVRDKALLTRFADAYDLKYRFRPDPDDPNSLTCAVRPLTAFAWRERDFPESATRWRWSLEP